jgi:hypothetical protein
MSVVPLLVGGALLGGFKILLGQHAREGGVIPALNLGSLGGTGLKRSSRQCLWRPRAPIHQL